MNNNFDLSDKTLKEKLRNCKEEKELQELMKEAGDMELSDDELDLVSGGIDMPVLPNEEIQCTPFFIGR